jgi:hypothetical protein
MNLLIGMNLYQHFAMGMQHHFISYLRNGFKRVVGQEAFAYREKVDEMNYAKQHGDPSIPLSRQTLFKTICKDWLYL